MTIKTLKINTGNEILDEKLLEEFRQFSQQEKPGIVSIIDQIIDNNELVLILEKPTLPALRHNLYKSTLEQILKTTIAITQMIKRMKNEDAICIAINPENIFIDPVSCELKLDCSLYPVYKICQQTNQNILYQTENISYLSPELAQRNKQNIDYRSCLYSLGIILYEMISGEKPFKSTFDDPIEILHAHIALPAEDIREKEPDIPTPLRKIITKLLNKMPDDRYQNPDALIEDLSFCLDNLHNYSVLEQYQIASHDNPATLFSSDKVYGRKKEIEELKKSIENIKQQQTVFLTGGPGSGKSTLVNEIDQFINEDTIKLSGKFEQYEQNIPFLAFKQVFSLLADYILTRSDHELKQWKNALSSSLKENSIILNNFIPAFRHILEHQNNIITSNTQDSLNRFNHTIVTFLKSVTSLQPIIIVIEDMQWADYASIKLLETILTDDSITNLLVIATHRNGSSDNSSHIHSLKKLLQQRSVEFKAITLDNFGQKTVRKILQETFNSSPPDSVIKTIFEKTQGNPFFINQLVSSLSEDNQGQKDNYNKFNLDEFSDNVIDLIKIKFDSLDNETRELLQISACIGNSINLDDIHLVSQLDFGTIKSHLSSAVKYALVKFESGNYRFHHDRIQQAIVETIASTERITLNRKIGFSLLQNNKQDRLYEAVNQLNKAMVLFTEQSEKHELMQLNSKASDLALRNNAYHSAMHYSQTAISLLPDNYLKNYHPEFQDIVYQYARACYLTGNAENALELTEHLLSQTESLKHTIEYYALYKDIIANNGNDFTLSVKKALSIFKKLNITLPTDQDNIDQYIKQKSEAIENLLIDISIDDLLNSVATTSPEDRLIMKFMTDAWEASYYAGDAELMHICILKIVELSINKGICNESAFGFVVYAFLLSLQGNMHGACEYGEFALRIVDKFDDKMLLPKVTNLYCNYINFYSNNYSDSAERYEISANQAALNGDYLFGVWANCFLVWSHFLAGNNLDKISILAKKHQSFVNLTRDLKMQKVYNMLQHMLYQYSDDSNHLADNNIPDYDEYLQYWNTNQFLPGPTWYSILQAQVLYIYGSYADAINLLERNAKITSIDIIMFPATQLDFIHSMSLLADAISRNITLSDFTLNKINQSIETIDTYCKANPGNYLYQKKLVLAELNHLQANREEANQYYLEAISESNKSGTTQNIALSYERYAIFLINSDPASASAFLINAIEAYEFWGAYKKSKQLQNKFQTLISENTSNKSATPLPKSENSLSYLYDNKRSIDLISLLKITQSISGITETSELIEKSMGIIIKEAGADRAILIKKQNNDFNIAAISSLNKTTVYKHRPLSELTQISHPIIRYCIRTGESIILPSDDKSMTFFSDPYMQYRSPKSVLCMPFYHNDNLFGLLYLENSLTEKVFSTEKLSILTIILTQLSISLRNTELYSSLIQQIEETKQAEHKLRLSEERMTLSQRHAKLGTWDWNIITDEIHWSDMTGPIFGFEEKEHDISYGSMLNAIHPDDRKIVEENIQACFHGKAYDMQHRILLPDGTIRWVAAYGDVTRDHNNQPVRMLGVISDISAQKEQEHQQALIQKQLLQSQKMESLGLLSGGIAHDFNNILASVLGFTGLIIDGIDTISKEKTVHYLSQVKSAGERARDLVAQLLSFSKGQNTNPVNLDPLPIIEETVSLLHSTIPATINLHIQAEKTIPNILLDPVQLQQIIINLCINARDAIAENGSIIISVKTVNTIEKICTSCSEKFSGNYVEISVSDSGTGMDEDIIQKIFEPFFTTKEFGKGSGMGLSMVHGILHDNEGHIRVDSSSLGTNISIFLKISDDKKTAFNNNIEQVTHQDNALGHILVVDDEEMILTYLDAFLSSKGYRVTTKNDSNSALNLFKRNTKDFDLVITDLSMPGLPGTLLAKNISALETGTPIILCTGYSSNINDQTGIDCGIDYIMEKPINESDLLDKINSLLVEK